MSRSSTTPDDSSSTADMLARALEAVKRFDLTLEAFDKDFGHLLGFKRQYGGYRLDYGEAFGELEVPPIHVSREDVQAVLKKCLSAQITSRDLEEWAAFMTLMMLGESYEFERDRSGQSVLSSVLHLTATPAINGELTTERIRHFLECLETNQEPD